jgi:hypothetical protein
MLLCATRRYILVVKEWLLIFAKRVSTTRLLTSLHGSSKISNILALRIAFVKELDPSNESPSLTADPLVKTSEELREHTKRMSVMEALELTHSQSISSLT